MDGLFFGFWQQLTIDLRFSVILNPVANREENEASK